MAITIILLFILKLSLNFLLQKLRMSSKSNMTNASTFTINTVTTSNITNPNNPSNSAVDTVTDVANPTSAVDTATDVANSTSEWYEQMIRFLINQRKHRNREYYQIIRRSRKDYWASI